MTESHAALLIFNGKHKARTDKSGGEAAAEPRPAEERAREIVALLARHGIDAALCVTLRRKHARREARGAAKAGIPLVIAAGGDGTVTAVARGVRGSKTVLGIVPLGGRNTIAASRGIPSDLAAACALLAAGVGADAEPGWWGGPPQSQPGVVT
jgi:diacylglycerol kinase (ATP)